MKTGNILLGINLLPGSAESDTDQLKTAGNNTCPRTSDTFPSSSPRENCDSSVIAEQSAELCEAVGGDKGGG